MANVPLVTKGTGLISRLALRYSRRRFGRVVDPVAATAHHNGVLLAMGALETVVERGWRRLDPELRWLVVQSSAGDIGCSWCTDYGYFEGVERGVDAAKVRAVARWRTSDVFDPRERAVLEYAEAVTKTPATVPEELVERLHRYFNDAQIVELAAWAALENFRSRLNAALGLRSQGFSDSCALPLPDDTAVGRPPAAVPSA